MSIETIGGWLRTYGVDDFAGRCTFKYRDTIDFTVEVSADETFLSVSAVLGERTDTDDPNRLLRLLQLNHLGLETGGTCLSVDETGRHIVLWYSRPVQGMDAEGFTNLVGAFLDKAEELQQRVSGDPPETAAAPAPPRFGPGSMIEV